MQRLRSLGSTGSLGGLVAARLAARSVAQRLIVRDSSRAPRLARSEVAVASYLDTPAMVSALQGISTVFFVSAFETANRVLHHRAAADAFVKAGVGRVVYTSFLGAAPDAEFTFARDHFHTEKYLESAGLRFSALRSSLYQDILPDMVYRRRHPRARWHRPLCPGRPRRHRRRYGCAAPRRGAADGPNRRHGARVADDGRSGGPAQRGSQIAGRVSSTRPSPKPTHRAPTSMCRP